MRGRVREGEDRVREGEDSVRGREDRARGVERGRMCQCGVSNVLETHMITSCSQH